MIVDLKALPPEGEAYQYTEKSEEAFGLFDDILGIHPFSIQVEVAPMGNCFQVLGSVRTTYDETCSRCGYDIEVDLLPKINEILMFDKERPRKFQTSHVQNSEIIDESTPSVTYIQSSDFQLGEFLHEMMVFAMETYPKCKDQDLCALQKHTVDEEPEPERPVGHPAFAALKKKLKTQH